MAKIQSNDRFGFKDALAEADNVLKNAVKGISELITISSAGNINLDFRDVETTMRNGGGAIMAIGRANGDHRVERAILDALDSPLLHGNDINRAKRILFNIYSSEAAPILVQEMEEISEFFDQLDPDIDVIWGTSTDDSLGEDAKVIILAADMSNDVAHQDDGEEHDEEYYQELMNQLYPPADNGGKKQETATEPTFVVEEAEEPEPAVPEGDDKSTTTGSETAESDDKSITTEDSVEPESKGTLDRLKGWLVQKMKEVTE